MNFTFSEEQEQLREFVRQFLEKYSPETTVRELMETESGNDLDTWAMMADQLGLQSLIIPEEHGGQGFGYLELVVVLEEMGRALLCAPFFSTIVLAANTIIHSGDDAAKSEILPGIASGETIATLAFTEESGRWGEDGITMKATPDGDAWSLSGTKMYVLDGHTANLILVAALTDAGVSLFRLDADDSGLTRTALATMDMTRKQARLEFDNVAATMIGEDGGGWPVLERVLDLAAVALPLSRWVVPRSASTPLCSTPRTACSSVARSAASRPSSTSAPTCSSRSSRPSRPPTTRPGALRS